MKKIHSSAKTFDVYFYDGSVKRICGEQKKFCKEKGMSVSTFIHIVKNKPTRRKHLDIIKIIEVK